VRNHTSYSLPHYQKKRDDYQTDMEQFRDLLQQMDEHKNALRAKIEERSTELETTNAKWERMKAHVDSLQQTIASQGMSVEDLRKLQAEHKGIQEATDRMSKTVQQRQNALHTEEVEVAQVLTQLDVALSEYNGKLAEVSLALLSASAYKARLDRDQLASPHPQALLGVNFEGHVEPAVQQAQEDMRLLAQKAQQDFDDAVDQVQALEQLVDVAAAKLRVANDKAVKTVAVLDQERYAQSQTTAVHQREVGLLEEKTAALRDPVALEEALAALRRQCADLEAAWEGSVDNRQRQVQQLATQIQQCQYLLQEHEAAQRAELQDLLDYWKAKAGDLEPLQVPAPWKGTLNQEEYRNGYL
jgi:kinetochore protein NDC80